MVIDNDSSRTVFLSHSSKDNAFANELHHRLELNGIASWIDDRTLHAGHDLDARIKVGIEAADVLIALLGENSRGSEWVAKEIRYALDLQKTTGGRPAVIPLLLPGVTHKDLGRWFDSEPVGLPLEFEPGELDIAMPHLVQAIKDLPKVHIPPPVAVTSERLAELILSLSDPQIHLEEGKRRARATATLTYRPADPTASSVESRRFTFEAPIGPIEAEEMRWYLELYWRWPSGVYKDRAEGIEKKMPEWGNLLYEQMHPRLTDNAFGPWQYGGAGPRGFTISVDPDLPNGASEESKAKAGEAAAHLFSLPWELLHDGGDFLFQGAHRVRARRQIPRRNEHPSVVSKPPIRVLMVSPRPEDAAAGYIDHRVSARPVVEALAPLGDLARLTILSPPTYPAMLAELERAEKAGQPYHVLHFDGHGVFDPRHGVGALCFEDPDSAGAVYERASDLVDADKIAAAVHRVPLVFLEACQSAQSDMRVEASVAGKLLAGGVASVVAMTHSVLVETARRFVEAFYRSLLRGERIGQAMVAGQTALKNDPFRHKTADGPLLLQDWFVPVLYQEEHDPQLIQRVHHPHVQQHLAEEQKKRLGSLPEEPDHKFVGRSRELLAAERLVISQRYVTIRGEGGEGKTTLAAELARWLVATRRFERVAFVAFDRVTTADAALSAIGNQLVTNFEAKAGSQKDRGLGEVRRALVEHKTLLVLDNMETVLPPPEGAPGAATFDPDALKDLFALFGSLRDAHPQTRLLFTSREPLPEPFANPPIGLGRMAKTDAIDLVARTLAASEPTGSRGAAAVDEKTTDAAIERLVDAVGCHARALVLIAREVAQSGLTEATDHLEALMQSMHTGNEDDREKSLLASVKLSLDRLPADIGEQIRPLGVCVDGISLIAMQHMLQIDKPTMIRIAQALLGVGLAEYYDPGYLRFDPALAPTLRSELSPEEQEAARTVWAETMAAMAEFLYRQQFSDSQSAFALSLRELPNLLAGLEALSRTAAPEELVDFATSVEDLAQRLGRGQAVRQAEGIRTAAARRLGEGSHAAFEASRAAIERLLDAGRFGEAVAAAERLRKQSLAAGESTYPEAGYDVAMAHILVGQALKSAGGAANALPPLQEAERRFERLAGEGSKSARQMASVARTDRADCLRDLGRYDEAAGLYERGILEDDAAGRQRDVAVGRFQLGTVRLQQRRYAEALQAYAEARETFERMGEPQSVATAWHQIGMTYEHSGDFPRAEESYQQALALKRTLGDRSGESNTLNQLGNLYQRLSRHEEAVRFFSQAADIYHAMSDPADEGMARSNAAVALIALTRYDEARREIERAIECKAPFGHAAEPWKTYALLHNLERVVENQAAALEARRQATDAYLSYRRDGGESQALTSQLFEAVEQAITEGQAEALIPQLEELQNSTEIPEYYRSTCAALVQVLQGSRDPGLAEQFNLDYDDAEELLFLLERLALTRP